MQRAGCVAVLLALLACKADPATLAKSRAEISANVAKLGAAAKAIPPGAVETKKCDDAALRAANKSTSEQRLFINAFEVDALSRAIAGDEKAGTGDFAWLSSSEIDDIKKSKTLRDGEVGNAAYHIRYVVEHGHIALVRARKKVLPQVRDESFTPGEFEGDLVIVNLTTGKPACQVAFAAESSSEVKYRSRGPFQQDPERAAREDFQAQWVKAGSKALATISGEAVVTFAEGRQFEAKPFDVTK